MLHSHLAEHKQIIFWVQIWSLELPINSTDFIIFSHCSQPSSSALLPHNCSTIWPSQCCPHPMYLYYPKPRFWQAGEMALQLRAPAALPKDLHSRTQHPHGGPKSSSSKGSNALSWPLQAPGMPVVHRQTHWYIKIFKVSLPYKI